MTKDELEQAVERLASLPPRLTDLAASFPEKAERAGPSAGGFTLVEHLAHLRDIEREGHGLRIRQLLDDAQPVLRNIDGDRLAVERAYNSVDTVASALAAFGRSRRENVSLLASLSAAALEREGRFEGMGVVSLARVVEMMCEHDEDHHRGIEALRSELEGAIRETDGGHAVPAR
ncbi:MAG TPA: DinB family protein [Thermoanaerobaculia bacterium]|nr:DinB family protein [Thermoanaerobaculia bacterium]